MVQGIRRGPQRARSSLRAHRSLSIAPSKCSRPSACNRAGRLRCTEMDPAVLVATSSVACCARRQPVAEGDGSQPLFGKAEVPQRALDITGTLQREPVVVLAHAPIIRVTFDDNDEVWEIVEQRFQRGA